MGIITVPGRLLGGLSEIPYVVRPFLDAGEMVVAMITMLKVAGCALPHQRDSWETAALLPPPLPYQGLQVSGPPGGSCLGAASMLSPGTCSTGPLGLGV